LEKIRQINLSTFQKFCDSIAACLPVHDIDLCRWAINEDISFVNPLGFKASKKWVVFSCSLFFICSLKLHHFKSEHRIVSRKILKFITRKNINDEEKINNDGITFVNRIRTLIFNYSSDEVFKSNAFGINNDFYR
jgi:hypothetical protein